MGCAIALELGRRGASVRVLERSVPGAEASSAAAGMLAAQVESHEQGPLSSLCLASRERFGAWAGELAKRTGIDVEHRVCGLLRVAFDDKDAKILEEHAAWQRADGQRVELLTEAQARAIEPAIGASRAAAHYPEEARVDPPRWLRALRIGAERAGARFTSGALVRRVVVRDGRVAGVEMEGGDILEAPHVVIAAGSWSNLVPGVPLGPSAIRPARGQIVELMTPIPPLRGIVWSSAAYLSPRDDGRILVGSTLEFVGFERLVTAGAVHDLIGGAMEMVPSLRGAEMVRAWSAFRPHTPDELPFIGPANARGLWLATGHYRNGILLSPITAEIIAALIAGEAPPVDVGPFRVDR
ncbi:MAG: glycine oxidase ThiO [Polyangiaceae bacterium]|nr:glycine oxidase ThiO [Polyangiaceae bacterium]